MDSMLGKTAMSGYAATVMTDTEFRLFSDLIYHELGIKMPPAKKIMLTSRLSRRLKALGIRSFSEYYDFIKKTRQNGDEFNRMIEVVTTNKTDFFREPEHFRIMTQRVLPELTSETRFKTTLKLAAWSAGCSTGAEAYSIAMIMEEFLSNLNGNFSILATDISQKVLNTGKTAVYQDKEMQSIPLEMRKKYILRGIDNNKGLFRIVPELRRKISFRQINLMDRDYGIKDQMDIIFCRNVIIYFNKTTQIELFKKIYDYMHPGGFLFIGNSETLFGVNDRFIQYAPTVYRKPPG